MDLHILQCNVRGNSEFDSEFSWYLDQPKGLAFLRQLDRRERIVYNLFERQAEITAYDVARALGLPPRHVWDLLSEWVGKGWLAISEPSRKLRRYRLEITAK